MDFDREDPNAFKRTYDVAGYLEYVYTLIHFGGDAAAKVLLKITESGKLKRALAKKALKNETGTDVFEDDKEQFVPSFKKDNSMDGVFDDNLFSGDDSAISKTDYFNDGIGKNLLDLCDAKASAFSYDYSQNIGPALLKLPTGANRLKNLQANRNMSAEYENDENSENSDSLESVLIAVPVDTTGSQCLKKFPAEYLHIWEVPSGREAKKHAAWISRRNSAKNDTNSKSEKFQKPKFWNRYFTKKEATKKHVASRKFLEKDRYLAENTLKHDVAEIVPIPYYDDIYKMPELELPEKFEDAAFVKHLEEAKKDELDLMEQEVLEYEETERKNANRKQKRLKQSGVRTQNTLTGSGNSSDDDDVDLEGGLNSSVSSVTSEDVEDDRVENADIQDVPPAKAKAVARRMKSYNSKIESSKKPLELGFVDSRHDEDANIVDSESMDKLRKDLEESPVSQQSKNSTKENETDKTSETSSDSSPPLLPARAVSPKRKMQMAMKLDSFSSEEEESLPKESPKPAAKSPASRNTSRSPKSRSSNNKGIGKGRAFEKASSSSSVNEENGRKLEMMMFGEKKGEMIEYFLFMELVLDFFSEKIKINVEFLNF